MNYPSTLTVQGGSGLFSASDLGSVSPERDLKTSNLAHKNISFLRDASIRFNRCVLSKTWIRMKLMSLMLSPSLIEMHIVLKEVRVLNYSKQDLSLFVFI